MKNVGSKQRAFDIDVVYGTHGENLVLEILNGVKKVEVKTDRMAHMTGNVAIEYASRGLPSGIATTKADYWAFVIGENKTVIFITIERLKELARFWYKSGRILNAGDGNTSKIILIPINQLL
jgi:hypothetical protein